MHRILSLIAASALVLGIAGTADAAACKDPATGKFIKCAAAAAPAAGGAYTLDAKGRCRDSKGKMAKTSMCAGSATATTSTATPTGGMATTSAVTRTTASTASTASTAGPQCKKGKRCGNACIPAKDVCHK